MLSQELEKVNSNEYVFPRNACAAPGAVTQNAVRTPIRFISLSRERPTTREVFDGTLPVSSEQDVLERAFFGRVVLANGTVKTTSANRINDLNEAVMPYVAGILERPIKIMDVGASSGISTLEWYEYLLGEGVNCQITATDLTVYVSLLTLTPSLAVLIDRDRNILHLDVLGRGVPPRAKGLQGVLAGAVRVLFRAAMMIDANLPPLNGHTREAAKGLLLKCEPVALLAKRLIQHEALRVIEDDLLAANRPEFEEAFHVVRAVNILNRAYFPDQVVAQMIVKLRERLKQNGLLIVCKTGKNGGNDATIFRFTARSKFCVLGRLGKGSEIEELVTGI